MNSLGPYRKLYNAIQDRALQAHCRLASWCEVLAESVLMHSFGSRIHTVRQNSQLNRYVQENLGLVNVFLTITRPMYLIPAYSTHAT
jgi:hypothetical protein